VVALSWPNHIEHRKAKQWFRSVRRFATCPLTQLGICRVSTQVHYAASPADALAAIRTWVTQPAHEFWPDDLELNHALLPEIRGHEQFTDAYLFALAREHSGKLATLDAGVRSLAGTAPGHLEVV
jgi:hypothetical protein